MAGNQFGFKYDYREDLNTLFADINIRLQEYLGYYNLHDEDIVYIQVSFRLLDKMIYTDLMIDKDNLQDVSIGEKKSTLDLVNIPATTNENVLGECLVTSLDDNNNIKTVNVIIKGIKYNFMDIILEKTKFIKNKHIDKITQFDKTCKFYYIKSNIDYILVIKQLGDNII